MKTLTKALVTLLALLALLTACGVPRGGPGAPGVHDLESCKGSCDAYDAPWDWCDCIDRCFETYGR